MSDSADENILGRLRVEAGLKIPQLREEIQSLMAPYDAFDWMAHLFFANQVIDPNTYRESTFEGMSAIAELGARDLIARPSRAGTSQERLIDANSAQQCLAKIRSLAMTLLLVEMETPDPLAFSVRAKRLFLRHPSFEHQERDILVGLFGGDFDDDLRAELGFTIAEALTVSDCFRSLPLERLRLRAEETFGAAINAKTKGRLAAGAPDRRRQLKKLPRRYRTAATALTFTAAGDTIALTPIDIAQKSAISIEAVQSILDTFSVGFGYTVPEGVDWVAGFGAGYNPLLRQPIVCDASGNYLCIGPGLLLFALRDVLEEAIKDPGRREKFYTRRGLYLQNKAAGLLENALRPDFLERSLKYDFLGTLTDVDILLAEGSVAIASEMKSKLLSEPARRAAPRSLARELGEIVSQGAAQAERVRALIERDGGLNTVSDARTRRWLDLRHIKKVIPIVISLEDLSGVTTAIDPLVASGVLPDGTRAPLVIGIHDLEIMCDLSEFPAQLLHYFGRRGDVNLLRTVTATDELDYFMYYLERGLFFDDDLQRDSQPVHLFISSMTDDVDAYYMFSKGIRTRHAKRPRQPIPKLMRRTLEQLDAERPTGWLDASLALLDMGSESRKQFAQMHGLARRATQADGQDHDRSLVFGEFGITIMSSRNETLTPMQRILSDYCNAKRYQHRTKSWFGFGLLADEGGRGFHHFVNVQEPFLPDSALDSLCRSLGIRPSDSVE